MFDRILPTQPQQIILDIIRDFATQHGYSPTIRDIAAVTGTTKNSVVGHLNRLEQKGLLTRGREARSILLTESLQKPTYAQLEARVKELEAMLDKAVYAS